MDGEGCEYVGDLVLSVRAECGVCVGVWGGGKCGQFVKVGLE